MIGQTEELACPRCIFRAESISELHEHYGSYHQMLDYYVALARDKGLLDKMVGGRIELDQGAGGECSWCGFKSTSTATFTQHQLKHVKMILADLPVMQPFICPVCWYESSTRLSLVRHFAENHGNQVNSGKVSFNSNSSLNTTKDSCMDNDFDDGFLEEESEFIKDTVKDGTLVKAIATYKRPANTSTTNRKRLRVLSNKPNPLRSVIESFFVEDSETEEDDIPEMDMSDLLDHWTQDSGIKTGICHDFEEPKKYKEPGLGTLAPRHAMTMQESTQVSPDARHSWLCDGRLLQLYDAISPHNMALFQYQWDRGQPVLISNSNEYMNHNLWHPKAFAKDFGHIKCDLVNTLTGKTVPKQPLKWFWEGFENVSHRLLDKNGTPMLLKLKDWPPDGDIAEYIPKRFHDLVHDFPIQPYTLREGNLNLASYIPDYFLRPELGPKMYIAYGNALYSNKASTNLHLDMSDAVNLLVYVGIPTDTNANENIKLVLEQVDEAGCDLIMKRRVRDGELPGALWHIFHPGDTNKIRDLLNKVAIEKRKRLDPHDDPIHDQSTYLDAKLRKRLYEDYGVQGYAIIQCAGDTVFIPAGACHQVRNLHNCIKIAEDFVSPELANNCLHLTQEFRHLTEHHTNHEDKLQIKNIIYHSVKNAVTKLADKMREEIEEEQERVGASSSQQELEEPSFLPSGSESFPQGAS